MASSNERVSVTVDLVVRKYERLICDALNKIEVDELRQIVTEIETWPGSSEPPTSPTRRLAADILRRARILPTGPDRNELRQIAISLLWLDRRGLASKALLSTKEVRT